MKFSSKPNLILWLYKAKVILNYLCRGDILVLLRKLQANSKKLTQFLQQMGNKLSPTLFTTAVKPCKHITLIIDHYLGGGANFYREQKTTQLLAENSTVILLLNDPIRSSFLLCYIANNERFYSKLKTFTQVAAICAQLPIQEIILNNCVSYANAAAMPNELLTLKEQTKAKLRLLLHDYFMICPSYNLLNYQDKFCNIPNLEACRNCLSQHQGHFTDLLPDTTIDKWRKNWLSCLQAADSIDCFSYSSKNLLLKSYPDLSPEKIQVEPHRVDYISYQPQLRQQDFLHIAIVGAINRKEKGRDLVLAMIKLIEDHQLSVRISIIGSMNQAPKSKILKIIGPYQRQDLGKILEKSGANLCFMPSIWPETFSYVSEEIIKMNLPLAVFNLGAPAERVTSYSQGLLIDPVSPQAALTQLLDFWAAKQLPV